LAAESIVTGRAKYREILETGKSWPRTFSPTNKI